METPKTCIDCGSTEVGSHYKAIRCIPCQSIATKLRNREAHQLAYHERLAEQLKAKSRKHREENKDYYRDYQRVYQKKNREKLAVQRAAREANKLAREALRKSNEFEDKEQE